MFAADGDTETKADELQSSSDDAAIGSARTAVENFMFCKFGVLLTRREERMLDWYCHAVTSMTVQFTDDGDVQSILRAR